MIPTPEQLFQAAAAMHQRLSTSPLTGNPGSPVREIVLRTPRRADLDIEFVPLKFRRAPIEVLDVIQPAMAISGQMRLQTRAAIDDKNLPDEVNVFAMGYSAPARRVMPRVAAYDDLWRATDEIGCHLLLGSRITLVEVMTRLELLPPPEGGFIIEDKAVIGDPNSDLTLWVAGFMMEYIRQALELTAGVQ